MNRRLERINVLLREEISRILSTEIRDPRLSALVSVTRVESSPDLHLAKVYVSVLGDAAAKSKTLTGLRSASSFVRRSIRQHVTLRTVPSVNFYVDESIEQGTEVLKLINDAVQDLEIDRTS
tara:strand:- start:330 stop:695 length:366 start_codon:yes stop_codon:yes gene_type:complete